MEYKLTVPCPECPFLKKNAHGYKLARILEFSEGEFPCHRTATYKEAEDDDDGESGYVDGPGAQHCAGALIFNEKREMPHQMMRICERLGFYDMRKLNKDKFDEVRDADEREDRPVRHGRNVSRVRRKAARGSKSAGSAKRT